MAANGAQAPKDVITVEVLDQTIDRLRSREQALKKTARDAEAAIKEIRPRLYALVALKTQIMAGEVEQVEADA